MNTILNYPLVWTTVLGIVLALLAGFGASKARGGVKRTALYSIAALCLLAPSYLLAAVFAPQWIDARYRAYKALYADIEVGMTRDQVIAAVDKHYPENGSRQRPKIMKDTAGELGFFMNPEHSHDPNCEGIFLDIADGRVVRKHYSED